MERRQERLKDATERWCPRGKHMVPVAAFSSDAAPYCLACAASYIREKRADSPDPLRSRREGLARYGLTVEKFDEMLAAQGGRCAICRTDKPGGVGGPRGWHVDHDHTCCDTRKRSCGKCNRGVICTNCNHVLGNAKDDREILLAAVDYLDLYRARRDAEGHTSSV